MIYEKEKIKIDRFGNRELVIFDYYDGIKGECNIEDGLILFWHDYGEDGEFWFVIKTDKELIRRFLKNEITALNLFENENSEVYLYKRPYDNYD